MFAHTAIVDAQLYEGPYRWPVCRLRCQDSEEVSTTREAVTDASNESHGVTQARGHSCPILREAHSLLHQAHEGQREKRTVKILRGRNRKRAAMLHQQVSSCRHAMMKDPIHSFDKSQAMVEIKRIRPSLETEALQNTWVDT